jgi:hypothetical protein
MVQVPTEPDHLLQCLEALVARDASQSHLARKKEGHLDRESGVHLARKRRGRGCSQMEVLDASGMAEA